MSEKYKSCSNKNCDEQNPQPVENFYKRSDTACGLYSRCKSCCKYFDQKRKGKTDGYKRKWAEKNKDKKKEYYEQNKETILQKNKTYHKNNKIKIRNYQLKRNYGITLDEYNKMLVSQNHRCAICEVDEVHAGKNGLYVDHNHETNQVRGLLCPKCNFLIGLAQENTSVLQEAIEYLRNEHAQQAESIDYLRPPACIFGCRNSDQIHHRRSSCNR